METLRKIKNLQGRTTNVLSPYRSGALMNLKKVTQEYDTDLLAIQEIRWLLMGILEKNCIVYYSCHANIDLELVSLSEMSNNTGY
jgi:hypothetical protein